MNNQELLNKSIENANYVTICKGAISNWEDVWFEFSDTGGLKEKIKNYELLYILNREAGGHTFKMTNDERVRVWIRFYKNENREGV